MKTPPELTISSPGAVELGDILEAGLGALKPANDFPRATVARIKGRWYAVLWTAPDEVYSHDIVTGMIYTNWREQADAVQSASDRTHWLRSSAGQIEHLAAVALGAAL